MAEGVYDGVLPPDVPAGRCTLSIRLGTFDTADDPDDKPEQRIPTGATLTLTPNVTGPVILPDGTIMVIKGTVLTSDTGTFDFWAIDGQHASVNPSGWNWTATLKIDASTQVKFTFSPDSTSPTPINLGTLIPISDPQTGVATVVGRGVASISVDPDTRHVLFVMSDNTTYDAGAIPPGPKGDPGAGGGTNTHTGTGFPAAGLGAVGDTYLDTAATSGALIWRKWPSGWRVQQGDTGWRDCRQYLSNGAKFSRFALRRIAGEVFCSADWPQQSASDGSPASFPSGFRPFQFTGWTGNGYRGTAAGRINFHIEANYVWVLETAKCTDGATWEFSFATDAAWPSTLPGNPA